MEPLANTPPMQTHDDCNATFAILGRGDHEITFDHVSLLSGDRNALIWVEAGKLPSFGLLHCAFREAASSRHGAIIIRPT